MPGKHNGVAAANGGGSDHRSFMNNFDPDDPEYIRDLQRPAAIKEDLNEMDRRKRVKQILESKSFCRELEELVKLESENSKSDPEHLKTLQRLSELTLPHAAASLHGIQGSASVVPITDLRGIEKYTKQEKILRNKLSALYRLVDLFQWSQGIYNHITLRVSPDSDEILINPFGLLYHEVTAGSLVKVNLNGDIIDPGSTKLGINQAGFVLHSAIHRARPDVRCIMHMHTAVVGAVSSMKCGLLPICQEALIIGPVSYHDYQGIIDDEAEREAIARDLGTNKVMLLRNHGFVACGETVEQALHLSWNVVLACETQIRAARAGIDNLIIPDEQARQRAYRTAQQGGGGVLRTPNKDDPGKSINWRVGELEWEAWMRVLDNAGFRTGHIYRQPYLRSRTIAPSTANQNDVAVPPSASSMGAIDETDGDAVTAHKIALLRKEQERARWLNSPNAYQKVEVLETGTDNPKVITKWVQDATSPSHSTAVKISSPHQFSPFGINPKEFKDKQRLIKENRRLGATSAGPQSQILDGVTYEDMAHIRDAEMSGMMPQERVVMIGTASKGIIDRPFQHNAQVYRQLYAPNPFASETDEDIQKYMKEVESKSPRPESAAMSRSAIDRNMSASPPPYHETESPSAETVSLMQAAREHRTKQQPRNGGLNNVSASIEEVVDGAEISGDTSARKSDTKAVSDDELDHNATDSNKKKKKKKGFFSFGRKKKQ